MYNSSWQNCPDTGQSMGSYVLFCQGGAVDYSTYVPTPVSMSSAKAECNSGAVAGMAMSHIRMLQNKMNGEEAAILYNCPVIMYCDNASAVTVVNSDKDIQSLHHCKRRLLYMCRLRLEGVFQNTIFLVASLKVDNFFNNCILMLQIQPYESLYKHKIKMSTRKFTPCKEKIQIN